MGVHKKCEQEIKILRYLLKEASSALKTSYGFILKESEKPSSPAREAEKNMKDALNKLEVNGF